MKKYTIHFWSKEIEPVVVSDEIAEMILKAKSEGVMFELNGGFYESTAVNAIVPIKQDPAKLLSLPEKAQGKPVTRAQIEKMTKELQDKGLLLKPSK